MDREFASGAAGSPPTHPASPSVGYPTSGNPGGGTPATKPGPWWYHMITEELRGVLVAAGLTPSGSSITQLAAAIQALIVAAFTGANQSLAGNGYQKLPGGLIIQWGTFVAISGGTAVPVTFPIAFPNACLSVVATQSAASTVTQSSWVSLSPTLTGVSFGGTANGTAYWFAIGR